MMKEKMDFLENKNILVTGATGLVGTNALIRLKTIPGVNIRAVYHMKEPEIFSDNISYVKADLMNPHDCVRIVKDIDYVMMFAARIVRRSDNFSYIIPNLIMNLQLLEASYDAEVKKILWLSSATAYPPSDIPLKEEQMFYADPHPSYFALGWTTRYIETLCRMYATKLKRHMTIIIIRPTSIYGEYGDFDFSSCHVLHALIRKVVERHSPLEIWGSGDTKRDFIYVGDVIDACFLAFRRIDCFTELNIGMGKLYSVKEVLNQILAVDNYSNVQIVFDRSRAEKAHSISVDCERAKNLIGFEAKTSIEAGIVRTMKWFRTSITNKGTVSFNRSLRQGEV